MLHPESSYVQDLQSAETQHVSTDRSELPEQQAAAPTPIGPSICESTPQGLDATNRATSPFSADRAALRAMTLPQHPDLDIPASPLGSPNPAMAAKVSHFLGLKSQGIHFNAKLASAPTLQNPNLLPKLMHAAGITAQGAQYDTSLGTGLWDPQRLIACTSVEEIDQAQRVMLKQRHAATSGKEREFVKAGAAAEGEARLVSRSYREGVTNVHDKPRT